MAVGQDQGQTAYHVALLAVGLAVGACAGPVEAIPDRVAFPHTPRFHPLNACIDHTP